MWKAYGTEGRIQKIVTYLFLSEPRCGTGCVYAGVM